MKSSVKLAACLVVTLCAVASIPLASAQTTSPSAYVYLLNVTGNTTSELDGYSADANGSLTRLSGSPFGVFNTTFGALAHTAHWVFVTDGVSIYSFSIASNGSLKLASTINAEQYTKCPGCGSIAALNLDRTGSTLYALSFYDDGSNNAVQFYNKNSTTGALTYFGSTPESIAADVTPFLGNNEYGYSLSCAQAENFIYAVHRNSDGSLTPFDPSVPIPTNPNGDYCTDGDAPYSTNNLAIALLPNEAPPAQLAVYTADSSGNLSTNSTSENMPTAAVGWPYALLVSPAGNLLAIGGASGLQVFHVNGTNPITSYTGLIAAHRVRSVAWDANNHLFAIGSGKVNAFKVTSTSYKQAPGSPYAINAEAITVLSLSGSSAGCAPPSSAGVKICSPANGSTDSSPVGVSAAATASSGLHITAMRLYVDAKAVHTSTGNTLNTSVSLAAGTHNLTVVGYESNGSSLTARETITVK